MSLRIEGAKITLDEALTPRKVFDVVKTNAVALIGEVNIEESATINRGQLTVETGEGKVNFYGELAFRISGRGAQASIRGINLATMIIPVSPEGNTPPNVEEFYMINGQLEGFMGRPGATDVSLAVVKLNDGRFDYSVQVQGIEFGLINPQARDRIVRELLH
jgi:hypothetical protein